MYFLIKHDDLLEEYKSIWESQFWHKKESLSIIKHFKSKISWWESYRILWKKKNSWGGF